MNPYLRRKSNNIGSSGVRSEKLLSKKVVGVQRPASGALDGAKGDIEVESMLIEAKSTTLASMSLKLDWLLKISEEALAENKVPAVAISFVKDSGKPVRNGEWVMVPLWYWDSKLK